MVRNWPSACVFVTRAFGSHFANCELTGVGCRLARTGMRLLQRSGKESVDRLRWLSRGRLDIAKPAMDWNPFCCPDAPFPEAQLVADRPGDGIEFFPRFVVVDIDGIPLPIAGARIAMDERLQRQQLDLRVALGEAQAFGGGAHESGPHVSGDDHREGVPEMLVLADDEAPRLRQDAQMDTGCPVFLGFVLGDIGRQRHLADMAAG